MYVAVLRYKFFIKLAFAEIKRKEKGKTTCDDNRDDENFNSRLPYLRILHNYGEVRYNWGLVCAPMI